MLANYLLTCKHSIRPRRRLSWQPPLRPTGIPSFDAAFDQFRESGEQVLAAARKAGNLYLDSYEKAVDRTTELQLKLAGLTQQEWLKSLIEAQVDSRAS